MDFESTHLISQYGYLAVGGIVGLESIGVPLPGETTLVAAATFAGATHHLDIGFVIAAAAMGAIIGDTIGFFIGREVGWPLLHRHGPRVGLTEPRLKLGQYLFLRHGGKVVFFGRFVAVLRTLAALLAGANRMFWPRFLVFNAAGGIVWATVFGFGAYLFGAAIERYAGPVGSILLVIAIVSALVGFVVVRRHEQALIARAERALPGPLTQRR
jgi:membrane protein DedA with SNARE-associated domain